MHALNDFIDIAKERKKTNGAESATLWKLAN